MPNAVDKVIVSNRTALVAKYGAAGVTRLTKAIKALIAADNKRGIGTRLVFLDNPTSMKGTSAAAVTQAADCASNKAAIDGIYRAWTPDYIVILGAHDVIPHQDLANPVYAGPTGDDLDRLAYGDLPYACESPYSKDINDFLGPTRVVSRLPDLTGGRDPAYLENLLKVAAGYAPREGALYGPYFAVTAAIWKKSSSLSTTQIFGSDGDLKSVPSASSKWPTPTLRRLVHFFNCHGADTSEKFYGQPASGAETYPVALRGSFIDGKIAEGTIVAAECCYGAQLFDPKTLDGRAGMSNVYLANKAYGFFGSTTIAYGPEDSNADADLLCIYFLQNVLSGASLGRSVLQARQQFIRASSPLHPMDLKTLAQFNLYGDASLTPVKVPSASAGTPKTMAGKALHHADRVERNDRRRVLFTAGASLATSEPRTHRVALPPGRSVSAALKKHAAQEGIAPSKVLSFVVRRSQHQGPSSPLPKMLRIAGASAPSRFHVLFGSKRDGGGADANVVDFAAVIAKEVGGKIVSFNTVYAR